MGTDIHSWAIDKDGNVINSAGVWADSKQVNPGYGIDDGEPFGWRSYSVFAFLAGVRNYSEITPISEPRGYPSDMRVSEDDLWYGDGHSESWLSIEELNKHDYDRMIVDERRGGEIMLLRDYLGRGFFHDLAELNRIGADRVVFCFDS